MSAYQKNAFFNLIVAGAALALFLALIPLLGFGAAQGAFGLLGLTGFGALFFRRRRGEVILDERDAQIQSMATQVSLAVVWVVFVGGVLGSYYYLHHLNPGTIGLEALPFLVLFGWVAFLAAHSTTVLVLYRRS